MSENAVWLLAKIMEELGVLVSINTTIEVSGAWTTTDTHCLVEAASNFWQSMYVFRVQEKVYEEDELIRRILKAIIKRYGFKVIEEQLAILSLEMLRDDPESKDSR